MNRTFVTSAVLSLTTLHCFAMHHNSGSPTKVVNRSTRTKFMGKEEQNLLLTVLVQEALQTVSPLPENYDFNVVTEPIMLDAVLRGENYCQLLPEIATNEELRRIAFKRLKIMVQTTIQQKSEQLGHAFPTLMDLSEDSEKLRTCLIMIYHHTEEDKLLVENFLYKSPARSDIAEQLRPFLSKNHHNTVTQSQIETVTKSLIQPDQETKELEQF